MLAGKVPVVGNRSGVVTVNRGTRRRKLTLAAAVLRQLVVQHEGMLHAMPNGRRSRADQATEVPGRGAG